MYHVIVQAYRGLPPDENRLKKPDAATVEVDHIVQGAALNELKRGTLRVECKAPSKYQPGQWNTVMKEAVKRLSITPTGHFTSS